MKKFTKCLIRFYGQYTDSEGAPLGPYNKHNNIPHDVMFAELGLDPKKRPSKRYVKKINNFLLTTGSDWRVYRWTKTDKKKNQPFKSPTVSMIQL